MNKKQKRYYNHLTIEERLVIQTGIENGARKSDIAKHVEKMHQLSQKKYVYI